MGVLDGGQRAGATLDGLRVGGKRRFEGLLWPEWSSGESGPDQGVWIVILPSAWCPTTGRTRVDEQFAPRPGVRDALPRPGISAFEAGDPGGNRHGESRSAFVGPSGK